MSEPWERIQRFYNTTRRPVTVLVAYDADATAACHTLTSILKSSLIQHSVQPVLELSELQAVVSTLNEGEDAELVVLIGLGNSLVLSDVFVPARHVVVVLDSTRPVRLENLREEGVVAEGALEPWLVLWQSDSVREDVETFFDRMSRRQARRRKRQRERQRKTSARKISSKLDEFGNRRKRQDASGEAHNVDSEGSASGDENAQSESSLSQDSVESDSDATSTPSNLSDASMESDEDDDADTVQQSQQVDWRNAQSLDASALEAYYSMRYSGQSVALTIYDVSISLNRGRDQFLWCAAVGVTDLLLRQRCDYSTYLVAMTRIRDHVALQAAATRRVDGEATAVVPRLQLVEEPQLYLLRHWSLWSAIWHGRFTSALLRLHHVDRGEEILAELLARCGVSLRVAQQSWMEVPAEDRIKALDLVCRELEKLEWMSTNARGADPNADEVDSLLGRAPSDTALGRGRGFRSRNTIPLIKTPNVIGSITRSCGFGVGVSAFDLCHLHAAVVCATIPHAAFTDAPQYRTAAREHRKLQFWKAFDLLVESDPNSICFQESLGLAKQLQSSVAVATSALLQRGVILSSRSMHYMLMNDPGRRAGAMDSFYAPLRLSYLCDHVAASITVERGRRWAMRPLLLTGRLPVKDDGQDVFCMALSDEGASNGPQRTLPAAAAARAVVAAHELEEPGTVLTDPLLPSYVVVRGKDSASHFVEAMYLAVSEKSRQ